MLAAVVCLSACSTDDTYLPALLADPMADYEAEGIELVDGWEQAERPGFLGGKPTHAEVGRTYRIVDQSQAGRILAEAAESAESQGWRMQPESPHEYRGERESTAGMGRLHLSIPAEDALHDPDGPRVLRILLDFGPVRFDEKTVPAAGE